MPREYEIVTHSRFRNLNVFLVRLVSRTSHLHQELELGMILEGQSRLLLGAQTYELQAGDLYLVNPMDAHEFLAGGKGALILSIQLSPRFLEGFLADQPELRFLGSPRLGDHLAGKEETFRLLRALCLELAHAYLGSQPDCPYRCFSLAAQLHCLLQRHLPNRTLRQEEDRQRNDRILSILDHIEENYTHKLLLEDIARREGLSMPYLSHLFKDTLGISFQDYLKEKRFEHACTLIATTQRKILDISISSGFSDVRYLTKLFQERYGCTPKEFRSRSAPARPDARSPESSQFFFTQQDAYLLLTPLRDQMLSQIENIPLTALWQ